MCGIWAIFGSDHSLLQYYIPCYNQIHHRGPDAYRIENDRRFKNCCLGFHRLAIVDDMFGMQPMRIKQYPHIWLLCNGEIYNFKRLGEEFGFNFETRCDIEVLIHLYVKGGIEFTANHLDGVFAFCLLDVEQRKVYLGRDTFGVRPAFTLVDEERGFMAVCSEAKGVMGLMKGLGHNATLNPLKPGHVQTFNMLEDGKTEGRVKALQPVRFHSIGEPPKYRVYVPNEELAKDSILHNIRKLFIAAIRKRLMAHRRIGCLLSGGLDSSLVAAILMKLAKEENLPYTPQTFSIGMDDESPDILAARKVAAHIGSEHYEVNFTAEEAIQAIDEIIYHLESFDITTIRASIGMYLISRFISKKTDTVVLFSGEGADELAQGYIYFRDAPTASDGDTESRRLLHDLYMYDVLRADRTTAAHGLELRVPFLDHQFTNYYLSLPEELRQPKDKIKEKYTLRKAFDGLNLLPDEILWRHKEAFSDGVASKKRSLFTIIQEYADANISDEELASAEVTFPDITPKTKESYLYRKIFNKHFPKQSHWIPYIWMPRWVSVSDPSARVISHYAADENIVNGTENVVDH